VVCSAVPYVLGGKVNGLNGSGLVLTNGSVTLGVPRRSSLSHRR